MEKELKLGVGRTDITPAIGGHLYGYTDHTFSDSIHDRLSATAFVLQQDDKQAVLISATVCLIQTVLAKRICQEIETRFRIPKEHIILSATHTHAGPNTAANIGWGECELFYDGKKWTADTENMCSNDDKEFIEMLLGVFVKQIEVVS